eukprot:3300454-Lingulodinium_polyedra.AAC.1
MGEWIRDCANDCVFEGGDAYGPITHSRTRVFVRASVVFNMSTRAFVRPFILSPIHPYTH